MTSRSPVILLDRIRRAGISGIEISRRTGISDAMVRKVSRGDNCRELTADEIGKLQQLVAEVCPPAK